VADTGAGIGVQDVGRIFNPLFTTKSGGMGMGLSILPLHYRGPWWSLVGCSERPSGRCISIYPGCWHGGVCRGFVTSLRRFRLASKWSRRNSVLSGLIRI